MADDARESEVHGCGEEDGGDGQADNVTVVVRVVLLSEGGKRTYIRKGVERKMLKCMANLPQ